MDTVALLVVMASIFVWGVVSARVARADLTAPIVFTVLGAGLTGVGVIHASSAGGALSSLIELTLVWVLFADAARSVSRTSASAWGSLCVFWASASR